MNYPNRHSPTRLKAPLNLRALIRTLLLLVPLFSIGACATTPSGGTASDQEIARLKKEIDTLKRQVAVLNRRLNTMESGRQIQRRPIVKRTISFAGNPKLGSKNARIAIVEFSDYQCPFCKRFHARTFDQIKNQYVDTGKLLYVYRDYPLRNHSLAPAAAVAANCAGAQGAYWTMQRALFAPRARLRQDYYLASAKRLKLDLKQFQSCLTDKKQMDEVMRDTRYGASLGIRGTPAFFIGRIEGEKIVGATPVIGAQPFSAFARVIETTIQRAQ